MKIRKGNNIRFVGMILAIVLLLSMSTVVFATESKVTVQENSIYSTEESSIQPRGTLSGYGQGTVSKSNGYTTFTVPVSGSYSTAAGMTIKTSGNSDAFGYITVYKPDGSNYKNQLYFSGNQEDFYQLYFVNGGNYTVTVDFIVPYGNPVTVECWIYA